MKESSGPCEIFKLLTLKPIITLFTLFTPTQHNTNI